MVEKSLFPPFRPAAVLTDYDRSLCNLNREISPETWEVLRQAFWQLFPICLSTGRTYPLLVQLLAQFPPSFLHVVGGGGQIIDSRGKVVWSKELSGIKIVELCRSVEKLGGWFGFAQGDTFVGHAEVLSRVSTVLGTKMRLIQASDVLENLTTPLVIVGRLNPQIISLIEAYPGIEFKKMVSYSGDHYFDITASGVNKAKALEAWSELTGISLATVVGIGDGLNDVEFLKKVGWSVAMGNSQPEILKLAQTVIGHVDQNGWPKYVRQLLNQVNQSRHE